MRPPKRSCPQASYQGVPTMTSNTRSQYLGAVPTAASFDDSLDLRCMLPSAAAAARQEKIDTPWHHMNHETTVTQPLPIGHVGGKAVLTAATLVPGFPNFSHGSGQPCSFDFQSVDVPFLLDKYPFVYQHQEIMPLYEYDGNPSNINDGTDNLVNHTGDFATSDHDLEDFYQSGAPSLAWVPNLSIPLLGAPMIPSAEMPPALGASLEFVGPSQDESGWEVVSGWPEEHQFSPDSTIISNSASSLEGPYQCIPWHSDQVREVYSGTTTYSSSSPPEALGLVSLDYPVTPPGPGRRGALSATKRQQTSKTRQMTACLRCQMQRKRVSLLPP